MSFKTAIAIAKTEKLIALTQKKLLLLEQLKASLLNQSAGYPVPERRQLRQLTLPYVDLGSDDT